MPDIVKAALKMFLVLDFMYLLMVGAVLYAKGKDIHRVDKQQARRFREGLIGQHQDLAKMFLAGFVFLLVLVELMVRFGEASERGWLFYLHLLFAGPGFVLLLLTYYRFNGLRIYGYKHSRWARWTLALLAGALLTGFVLFMDV